MEELRREKNNPKTHTLRANFTAWGIRPFASGPVNSAGSAKAVDSRLSNGCETTIAHTPLGSAATFAEQEAAQTTTGAKNSAGPNNGYLQGDTGQQDSSTVVPYALLVRHTP